jgi:hypothetical protein
LIILKSRYCKENPSLLLHWISRGLMWFWWHSSCLDSFELNALKLNGKVAARLQWLLAYRLRYYSRLHNSLWSTLVLPRMLGSWCKPICMAIHMKWTGGNPGQVCSYPVYLTSK